VGGRYHQGLSQIGCEILQQRQGGQIQASLIDFRFEGGNNCQLCLHIIRVGIHARKTCDHQLCPNPNLLIRGRSTYLSQSFISSRQDKKPDASASVIMTDAASKLNLSFPERGYGVSITKRNHGLLRSNSTK